MEFTTFVEITPIITSAFLFTAALMLKTENFRSSLVFKVIPFGLGICNLLLAAFINKWPLF